MSIIEVNDNMFYGNPRSLAVGVPGSQFRVNTGFLRSCIQRLKYSGFTRKSSKMDASPVIVKSPKKHAKNSSKITPEMCDVIRFYVDEDCLLTLEEINSQLESQYEIRYDLEKIAGCLRSFHYSVGRVPDLIPYQGENKYASLQRKVFARQIDELAYKDGLYFLGTTKLNINTRVDHGKKASPRWSIKSKTFTICVAMQSDGLFMYEAEEDPSPFSSSPNVSPAGSPEIKKEPYKFAHFFKKFMARLKENNTKKGYFVVEGIKLREAQEDDPDFPYPIRPYRFIVYPGDSTFFSPTELFFDQLRSYIDKFNPATPQDVFSAVKNIPSVIDEVDCSLYLADIMNFVEAWSTMILY